jgi:hypothetical protein
MAGNSYKCRIEDLGELIADMRRVSKDTAATFDYRQEVVEALGHSKWRRCKWFYYCDQQDGNTIRLYDREFFHDCPDLYVEACTYVILRGKNLGKPSGNVKTAIRRLPSLGLKPPEELPPGINTNDPEKCLYFFDGLNNDSGVREPPPEPPRLNPECFDSFPPGIKRRCDEIAEAVRKRIEKSVEIMQDPTSYRFRLVKSGRRGNWTMRTSGLGPHHLSLSESAICAAFSSTEEGRADRFARRFPGTTLRGRIPGIPFSLLARIPDNMRVDVVAGVFIEFMCGT